MPSSTARRVLRTAVVLTAAVASVTAAGAAAPGMPPSSVPVSVTAPTPPMGWNSWDAVGCAVTASDVEHAADQLVRHGLRAAGYRYVVIDDCWMARSRDAAGDLVPDPVRFPGGIRAVADYVHARGLKLGIYEDAGLRTCQGRPGSLGDERQDAAHFASWGVDYVKYDNCASDGLTSQPAIVARYAAMRAALNATGRRMVFSMCSWGRGRPWTWAAGSAELWRTTHDVKDDFAHVLRNFTGNVALAPFAGPGHWNDPDLIEAGNGGMTATEYRTQFSLWAMMAAPLMSSTDLAAASPATLRMLGDRAVIAVDQDRLGVQGRAIPVAGRPPGWGGHWVIVKPLAGGDVAVALFNQTARPARITVPTAQLALPGGGRHTYRELWSGRTGTVGGEVTATLAAHQVALYRVGGAGPVFSPPPAD